MKTSIINFVFIALLLPIISSSQTKDEYRNRIYTSKDVTENELIQEICNAKKIKPSEFITEQTRRSNNGFIHKKFTQSYKGLKVFGTSYIIHSQADKVMSSNGYLAPSIQINTTPKIDIASAERIAKKELPSSEYFDDRVDPIELMIIDNAFPKISGNYNLVYKVEVYAADPIDKKIFFVDAINGDIILSLPGLAHESTPAIARTKYYGEQEIITESLGDGNYILQDLTRGDGITTLNSDLTPFINNSTNWDLTNSNQDEVALDAHYATEKFYDMMLERLNWDGLDGNGLSMNPVVHANGGSNYVNAYWDGNNAWFGNGDCHRGPLTTLEVVAHEFMHGITDYTSDLIYSFESGAINESMSDIFGKAVEYYYDPDNFKWTIGESFLLTDLIEPFRYMDNPNRKNMPAFYKGNFWSDGGGVHRHSAIGNLWFHILVEGKNDIAENGDAYTVNGIGMDKAIEIVWQIQSNYLTPTSTYHDMYESSLAVTTSLYGDESPELNDVLEAWKAVGLPQTSVGSNALDHDIAVQVEFIPQRQCRKDEYLPFAIKLVNYGTQNIPDSSGLMLYVEDAQGNESEIEIIEPINSNESLTVDFDSTFYLVEAGRHYITAYTNYDLDQNSSNNNYNLRPYRIDNFDPIYNTLDFDIIDVATPCFTDSITFDVLIKNWSCNTIERNSVINYIIYDDQLNVIQEKTIVLENDLLSGERFTVPEFVIGNYPILSIEAFTDNNPNIDRIPEEVEVDYRREIVGEYFNDLSDLERNENELEIFKVDNLVEYNSNTYIAKSGGTQEELFYPCPNDADDFQSVSGYHNGFGSIATCLDLSEMENPIVAFDLVQFRDDSDLLPEFENLRTRAKVSWGEHEDEYVIIEGLEEGVEENIVIPLESNFKGAISIDFVHLTGTWYNSSNPDPYFEYDVNMVRNLEFKNVNNSTNLKLSNEIQIAPNPGRGLYRINSSHDILEIGIINLQGMEVLHKKIENDNTFDITELSDGYYIIKLLLEDGRKVSKSLIQITNVK